MSKESEEKQMTRSAYDVQRDFGLSSALRSEIIWDSLAPDQAEVLKQKIENLILDNEATNSRKVAKQREQLFRNVWLQRKYTNRTLLSAIIYVLVTPEMDAELALQSTTYSCHPVFRTRKCIKGENSEECCMIFIDEHGRVYANWEKFVFGNTLPKGMMIAPSRGIYTITNDEDAGVQLMVYPTPASGARHRILNVGDKVATVGSLVASVPVAAALAVPVGGPIILAATAVGVATAAYSTLRSANRLYDRVRHGQSTSITDSEARGQWLGVAGGFAVKGINVSSIVISGTGVANGVYDLYLKVGDDQTLSKLDILQIASSLVIFTHSINNLRIASKVSNRPTLMRALRNQTRKVVRQISQESIKLHNGSDSGKFDIVRTFNDIPFKEALLSLHKINAHLSQGASMVGALGATVLPNIVSLGSGGQMRLNLEMLGTQFGSKFVEHISSLGNLTDVLDALARYFSDKAVQLFMEMTRTFVEQNIDSIDRTLNTFVSTETVLYRILMHCVHTYDDFAVDFLERHRQDILDVISKYFHSLQPLDEGNCSKYECAVCRGRYYISAL
ncbi:GL16193 [Drosophila persimilis]|uniref:GL16193 n=1 Tax=Drosophila persimilis TaxID=7234 RepID=B4H5N7_DROPE|nr:GL16193 [Drosophila persimilis]